VALGHEVAVVGYAGRLPGAGSAKAFWSLLRDNVSSVGWITPDRFPTERFYHPSPDQPGRSYTFAAGLIEDVWGFDAAAFGMSPREAEQVDPQQRQLLEVTQDALAHAGIAAGALAGSETGVYVGASSVDYGARFFADPSSADVHMMTGNTLSILANRLSYHLDLHGPSFTVDTACSSSLVALCLAADAIRAGTVDTAIVGGVNLLLSPFSFVGFSRASMLSPTGRCRPFDAAADGYVRAEGAIVLVLRSLDAARKARNRIHGTVVGWGVGQDGRTTGLSLPSADSQRRLLDQVYGTFGLDPCELAFVEAHGTGTRVGDPVEADALGKALAQNRAQPLPIGSVKSNIGHLEPASGLAGVLKTILALERGVVPATLHQSAPNPDIPFDELNLRVIDRNWTLPERRGPALAGVNSFGFGGTNAHAVLRGEDRTVTVAHRRAEARPAPLLISAHTAEMLPAVAKRHAAAWPADRRLVGDFIATAAHHRDALAHRAIVHGGTVDELQLQLGRLAAGEASPAIVTGQSVAPSIGRSVPVAFVFAGNGAQWAGMGRAAWQSNAAFRSALEEIDGLFARRQKASLVELMFADDLAPRLRRAIHAQPLLLALQMATVRGLEALGLSAQATLGHSVGEIAAAWCAGALSTEQAIDVVIARSRHQETVRGSGTMAALMLGERDARRFLAAAGATAGTTSGLGRVDVAAVNSWRSVTVSGPTEEIDALVARAGSQRIGARRLDLDYPFHSQLIDPVRAPLVAELKGLRPRPARKRFVSSVTGAPEDGIGLVAEHWWRNVREPVRFEAGLNCLIEGGCRVFVEIGPRPILGSYLRDTLREAGQRGAIIETLDETAEADGIDALERCAARVAIAGGQLDRQRLFGPPPVQTVALPSYPWQHTAYEVQPTPEASGTFSAPANPLLGTRLRQDAREWFSSVDPVLHPWLGDHAVGGLVVFPAAGYVEVLLAAAREIHGEAALELREMDIVRPLVFDGATSFETLVRLSAETGLAEFLSRPRNAGTDWSLHARGLVGRSPLAEGPAVDLEAGRIIVPTAKVYRAARDLGFEYGERFQRVRQVSFPHPKRAVAVLADDPGVALEGQTIDITGLDAAFHALFATEEAGVADMPMKRMLPVRFGRIRAFAPGTMARHAVARTLRQSPGSIVADITLSDGQGRVTLTAESVRVIEAPVAPPLDARSLAYHTRRWRLPRPGEASEAVALAGDFHAGARANPAATSSGQELEDAQLLLDAGCLRAAWDAFRDGEAIEALRRRPACGDEPGGDEEVEWPAYLCSALLWQLDTKGLIGKDGAFGDSCPLPPLGSVVRTLVARHPTMAAEAASLSRIGEVLGRLVAGHAASASVRDTTPWRLTETASRQVERLRDTAMAALAAALDRLPDDRLVRVLALGAEHARALAEAIGPLSHVEAVVTDLDRDRIEQAQAVLGDGARRVRCVAWSDLDDTGRVFDIAVAIDALSELAAAGDELARLQGLLRPRAPLIAAEPAPSLFWDIMRGMRPTWWSRSAHLDFPVGPLLTAREWEDELSGAGFEPCAGATADRPGVDVLLHAVAAGPAQAAGGPRPGASALHEGGALRWEGAQTPIAAALQEALGSGAESSASADATTPVAWVVDAGQAPSLTTEKSADTLTDALTGLASRCSALATQPAPPTALWVVVTGSMAGSVTGSAVAGPARLDTSPLWCAVTAAMRVAQNEIPALEIRCLGIGDGLPATLAGAALEMSMPGEEREIVFEAGARFVFRLAPGAGEIEQRPAAEPAQARQLSARSGSSRGALAWTPRERPAPGPHDVEIAVAATGLNFRDVMWNLGLLPEEALEDGYAGPRLGMECAGTVSAVGAEVREVAVGDRVVAFVSGGFASHVVAPAFAVSRLPASLGFEAAATLPVAYLTAYYALVHLAGLKPGETVLVHGGAGAVGLAALGIARLRGARAIVTAGSEEKRALLRHLGADAALNSRTAAFADEVATLTQGKGVDVVLNSLSGEAMARSLDCLRPFGRFVELGKRDFYANTHVGLRPFRRNLSYFGVDVDQLIGDHQDLTRRLFDELLQLLATGDLPVLPHRVFDGERVDEAFRLMQRSGHIGKIVVRPAAATTERAASSGRFPVDPDGVHLVIGGTGGFGLAAAEWLAGRGARQLVLCSRSGTLAADAADRVAALKAQGVTVHVARADVSDSAAVRRLIESARAHAPLKGIVHAAMVLDDRLIDGMDRAAIENVLQPKVAGALHLAAACDGLALDYLLLFSSATTLLGNPGQYNYVAANGFLEGLARQLRGRGVPALAVAWGGIEDTGYLARHLASNASLRKRFSSSLLPARTALDALDLACDAEGGLHNATLAIARIDWAMARRDLAIMRSPGFSAVVPAAGARPSAGSTLDLEKLRTLPVDQASDVLLEVIVEEIARVLRLAPKDIDRHRPLAEIGMDSLMMLELRTTVEETLQVELPIMSLANGITPVDVARRIAALVVGDGQASAVKGGLAVLSSSHLSADVQAMDPAQREAAAQVVLERVRRVEGPL
jgi:phthiocerol/phenolphthiocerol synthesis type-I polyketide synthase C